MRRFRSSVLQSVFRLPHGAVLKTVSMTVGLALLVAAVAAVGTVSSAVAAPKGVVGAFGGPGPVAGHFGSAARGVAVREATGDVFVVDQLNRVQRFDAFGSFLRAWGNDVEIGGGSGFEVCTVALMCQGGSTGTLGGGLNAPQGIAVDQASGAVYVSDQGNRRVQKFDSNGEFLLTFGKDVIQAGRPGDTGAGTEVCVVAEDCQAAPTGALGGEFATTFSGHLTVAPPGSPNAGNVYVADPANRRMQEFTAAGTFVRAFGADVDQPAGGTDFEICTVAANCKIAAASGPGVGQFSSTQPTRVAGDATGAIYTAESAGNARVQKFTPVAGPPPLSPSIFADSTLSGTPAPEGVAVDRTNGHLFAVKSCTVTLCPDAPLVANERRVFELDAAGTLVDTHAVGEGIGATVGLAVNPANDRIYLSTSNRVLVLGAGTSPDVALDDETDLAGTSTTLNATIDPNGSQTGYRFEIKRSADLTWINASASASSNGLRDDAGAGSSPTVVSQQVTGLQPNTQYDVRVVADGWGAPITTATESLATPVAVPTHVTSPAAVAATTTATLHARLVANGSPTSYSFEYGTDTNYGTQTPGGDVGSGLSATTASEQITGLQPNTTYHYRVIATNTAGSVPGPDRTFTTHTTTPTQGLPDNRAYELVSPPNKGGYGVDDLIAAPAVSPSGETLVYQGQGTFPDTGASGAKGGSDTYIAARGNDRWTSRSIAPQLTPIFGQTAQYRYPCFNSDLSKGLLFTTAALTPGAEPDANNAYLRDLAQGPFTLLTPPVLDTDPNPPSGGAFGVLSPLDYPACSRDLDHVAFRTTRKLTPDAPSSSAGSSSDVLKLYQWVGGELHYAAVLPDGTRWQNASRPGSFEAGGTSENAISADGSRLFFTVLGSPTSNPLNGELYMRRDAAMTVHVSASQRVPADPVATGGAFHWFLGATPDGTTAFFLSREKLTDDATTGATDAGCDLYRWRDGTSPTLTDLTRSTNPGDPAGARVGDGSGCDDSSGGVVGHSDNGERVYFVAFGVLAPGATSGQPNLYLREDDGTHWIATLAAPDDVQNWRPNLQNKQLHTRVSADGRYLLFTSTVQLTPYDNAGRRQVYRYDAVERELACVSCHPDGAPAIGDAQLVRIAGDQLLALPRNLSTDGNTVFFVTPDALVARDSNNRIDVYRWRDGEVDLISTGRSDSDSSFIGASADGDDAFFSTAERLVGWDRDDSMDVYDARVGGGLPEPPPPLPVCEGDECQDHVSDRPALVAPLSEALRGLGDIKSGQRASFSVRRPSSGALSRLIGGRRTVLRLRVSRPGLVSLVARARIGKRQQIVARASKRAPKAGAVELTWRLSGPARRRILRAGRLVVSVTVRFAGAGEPRRLTLRLRRTK